MPFDNVAAMERLRVNFASWPACAHCGEPSADHWGLTDVYGTAFRCPAGALVSRPQYEADKYLFPGNSWSSGRYRG